MTGTFSLTMARFDSDPAAAEDARLVAAAAGGDRDAFGELVRRHQARVFRLANRFFRTREEVEDAAQETFLRAFEKLHTYRAKAPFEHWLTRVCLNCCYRRLRRQGADEVPLALEPEAPAGDPTAELEARRLLSRLPPEDRFVLVQLHGEGRTTAEIARRLGWTRANVKVRAHRARSRLRRWLEEGLER